MFVNVSATVPQRARSTASIPNQIRVSGIVQKGGGYSYYDGSYEFTPTQSTQTIPISGLTARADITINPIPSNYGLITWNGSVLTVS